MGYDANALYLWAIGQNFPAGYPLIRHQEKYFVHEFPQFSGGCPDWIDWLIHERNIEIQSAFHGGEKKIGAYKVDSFCQKLDTVFEFYGDYWHCHPVQFPDENAVGNSSNGKLITNKEKHYDIVYVNESEIGAEIMDNHFYCLTELSNGYYEVENTKQKIILDLPIHLSVFILNYAKLHMLKFHYDCVDKYLSREDFEYSEMDTDSAYMAISGDSIEALIKPDLREEFENDKHNWFVTPRVPQGKRTPGLFKVEFGGDKIISLCSKSY